jgi:hypothetical protein
MQTKTVIVAGEPVTLYSADGSSWFYCKAEAKDWERQKRARVARLRASWKAMLSGYGGREGQ